MSAIYCFVVRRRVRRKGDNVLVDRDFIVRLQTLRVPLVRLPLNVVTPRIREHRPASRKYVHRHLGMMPAVLWTVLCVIVPVWVAPVPKTQVPIVLLILAYLVVLYAGSRITLIISAGEPVWLIFMFWCFTYIWIGLAMFAQDASGQNPYAISFASDSQQIASVIALAGMVAFDFGGRMHIHSQPRVSRAQRVLSRRRVIVLFVLTVIGVPLLLMANGSLGALFLTQGENTLIKAGTGNTQASTLIMASLIMMAPLVASASAIAILRTNPKLRRRPGWLVAAGIAILIALTGTNPVSSTRFMAGAVLLGLLFSFGITQIKLAFQVVSSSVLLALLLLFPYADAYRYKDSVLETHSLGYFLLSKEDYDTGAQMVAVVDYRSATGGTSGNQALGVLGFLIPRSYWPNKPGSTGSLIAEYLGLSHTNVSSPLWVEAYVDGGFIAVVAVFAGLGYILTRVSRTYLVGQDTLSYTRIVVPLIAAFSLIALRGSLVTAAGPLSVMLAIGWFVTRPERRLARLDSPTSPGVSTNTRQGPHARRFLDEQRSQRRATLSRDVNAGAVSAAVASRNRQ